jgi:hypothetical protein
MCTEPVLPRPKATALSKKRESRSRDLDRSLAFSPDDLETAMHIKDGLESVEMAGAGPATNPGKLTFAQVTDQIWHFSSTDYGPRCRLCDAIRCDMLEKKIYKRTDTRSDTCIGYNTLFATADPGIPKGEMNNGEDLPEGRRLWTWLVLCDDGK